jgi:hypothetical protein
MGFASTAMGATQLGLNLVGDYMSWKDQRENAKAQARALSQQANAVGKNLAYTFQNYELQRVDAFDAAVNSLMKVQTNALGLESSVRAAISEETGGDSRTGRALQRAAHADTLRTLSGIKDIYERQSDEISLNKEMAKRSAMDEIANIKAQAPQMPSYLSLLGNIAGDTLNVYNSYQNALNSAQSQGMELDTWWRAQNRYDTNPYAYRNNYQYHFNLPTYTNTFPYDMDVPERRAVNAYNTNQ